eukprot:5431202-Prymnesium_polylepis.1
MSSDSDVAATPLPPLMACIREAGCLDEPGIEHRPIKRKREEHMLSTAPVPIKLCPRHGTALQAHPVLKPGPNQGRTFCTLLLIAPRT